MLVCGALGVLVFNIPDRGEYHAFRLVIRTDSAVHQGYRLAIMIGSCFSGQRLNGLIG